MEEGGEDQADAADVDVAEDMTADTSSLFLWIAGMTMCEGRAQVTQGRDDRWQS